MRRVWLNLLVAALATSLALVVAEGLTRHYRDDVRFDFMAQHDVRTDIVDGVELWREPNPRSNAEDIRRAAANPRAFIILGLGDSIMYGVGVATADTYLEKTRRHLAGRTAKPVEVLNLAVPGYNTVQENAVYKEIASQIQPDLVLVHYWGNDVHQYRFVGGYVVHAGDISEDGHLVVRALPLPPRINDFLLMRSRLYALISRSIVEHQALMRAPDWTRVAEPLQEIHERAQRGDGRLLILASAELTGPVAKPTADLPQLQRFAAARGIEVIDLSEWLRGVDSAALSIDGCHFNAAGHELIGSRLAEYLMERDLKGAH